MLTAAVAAGHAKDCAGATPLPADVTITGDEVARRRGRAAAARPEIWRRRLRPEDRRLRPGDGDPRRMEGRHVRRRAQHVGADRRYRPAPRLAAARPG